MSVTKADLIKFYSNFDKTKMAIAYYKHNLDVANTALQVIREYNMDLEDVYDSRGMDDAELIYNCDGIEIYYCQDYCYMDILGLTENQWTLLKELYKEVK